MERTDYNTYRLLRAIEEQTMLSKMDSLGVAELLPQSLLGETANRIVWDESPKMKIALALGIPAHERRDLFKQYQEGLSESGIKQIALKYGSIINELITLS